MLCLSVALPSPSAIFKKHYLKGTHIFSAQIFPQRSFTKFQVKRDRQQRIDFRPRAPRLRLRPCGGHLKPKQKVKSQMSFIDSLSKSVTKRGLRARERTLERAAAWHTHTEATESWPTLSSEQWVRYKGGYLNFCFFPNWQLSTIMTTVKILKIFSR